MSTLPLSYPCRTRIQGNYSVGRKFTREKREMKNYVFLLSPLFGPSISSRYRLDAMAERRK